MNDGFPIQHVEATRKDPLAFRACQTQGSVMNDCLGRMFISAALLLTPSSLLAAESAPEAAPAEESSVNQLDAFVMPRPVERAAPKYPWFARTRGEEGWVHLNFMVSTHGEPYEITVIDSMGHEDFQNEALEAVKQWKYEPALYRGRAIDAGVTVALGFELQGPGAGARPSFVRAYRKAADLVETGSEADVLGVLKGLEPRNLYEDAFLSILNYRFALRFGTLDQQIVWLRRAVMRVVDSAGESRHYVDSKQLRGLYFNLVAHELEANDFAAAIEHAEFLKSLKPTAEQQQKLDAILPEVLKLKDDDRSYSVTGTVADDNDWHIRLFKDDFQVDVKNGEIAELKLRCDRRYIGVRFDPELVYSIVPEAGDCRLEVIGNPGTTFELIQH